MPSPETFQRKQTVTVWDLLGYDQFSQVVTDVPREILVRWERTFYQAKDAKGKLITIDAKMVVAEDVTIGSLVYPGTLEEWYGTGSAGDETELLTVVAQLEDALDIKGRKRRRVVGMSRHKSTPTGS